MHTHTHALAAKPLRLKQLLFLRLLPARFVCCIPDRARCVSPAFFPLFNLSSALTLTNTTTFPVLSKPHKQNTNTHPDACISFTLPAALIDCFIHHTIPTLHKLTFFFLSFSFLGPATTIPHPPPSSLSAETSLPGAKQNKERAHANTHKHRGNG